MIQSKELRIGNLLQFGEQICKVYHIEQDYFYVMLEDETSLKNTFAEIEPIPITEEKLLEFGFEYITSGIFKINEFMVVKWNNELCEYRSYYANRIPKEIVYLKFIHELQNLFFSLTKQELIKTL